MGFIELSRDRDELMERCEVVEWKISDAKKELVGLWANVDVVNYLRKEVDQYGRPSTLASQIEKLKASFPD